MYLSLYPDSVRAMVLDGVMRTSGTVSGHTAYALGHACVDDPVTAYLVALTVPDEGLSCPRELT
jgi:hypothetical protein